MTSSESELVSVIIPTYNQAAYLKEALASIRDQSYPVLEAIVINNFSDDDTVAVVEAAQGDSPIELVDFRNHGVIGASRNEGIRRARGEYLAFLDSDDTWTAEKLSRCVGALQSGYDLVCHGEAWSYAGGRTRNVLYGPVANATYDRLLYRGNCFSTSAIVVRRQVLDDLGGFSEDPTFVTAEDYELWLRIARAGYRMCFLRDILGTYRIHRESASSAGLRNMNAVLNVLDFHFAQQDPGNAWNRIYRRKRRSAVIAVAAWGLKQAGHYRSATFCFARALTIWPLNWKAFGGSVVTAITWTIEGMRTALRRR